MSVWIEIQTFRASLRFRRSEWGLAAILALGWGYVPLFVPGNSFSGPSLAWIDGLFGETWIATACIIIGTARLVTLIINGNWRRCSHARMVMAGMSSFIWATIFLGVLQSGTASPGLVTYLVFFAMDMHTIYEAGQDARQADEKRRASGT